MAYLDPEQGAKRSTARGPAVTNPAALTSVVAAGANPTKAEYDALRADVAALRTKVQDLLTSLRAGGAIR